MSTTKSKLPPVSPPGAPGELKSDQSLTQALSRRLQSLRRLPSIWVFVMFITSGALLVGWTLYELWPRPRTPDVKDPPKWVLAYEAPLSEPQLLLPRAVVEKTVPLEWHKLKLGMAIGQVDVNRYLPLKKPPPDDWADGLYYPDMDQREVFLGLSFFKDRLYRITHRFGDRSPLSSERILAICMRLYGTPEGYEYMTATGAHAVTIFKTEQRILKLDSLVTDEGRFLYEISLMDLDEATAREKERLTKPITPGQ